MAGQAGFSYKAFTGFSPHRYSRSREIRENELAKGASREGTNTDCLDNYAGTKFARAYQGDSGEGAQTSEQF